MKLERKDCWDVLWADDDPDSFAAMEKTRLCVYKNLEPEEPVVCSGYLASFKDLQVTSVVLEHVVQSPDKVQKDSVVNNDTARLRELKDKIAQTGASDAYNFVDANPHPRLWRHLAEAALEALDLQCADKAFVRCSDYQGIQFVKRLRALSDRMKRKAEVAAFFGRFEEAEQIYRDIDRKDLAIDLRTRLGDWQRVAELVRSGAGDDKTLQARAPVQPPVVLHPATGEPTWFCNVHSHSSVLRKKRESIYGAEKFEDGASRINKSDMYYGDDSDLDEADLAHMDEVTKKHTTYLKMAPGDAVLVDNYQTMHGRNVFKGTRKHAVSWFE